MFDNSTGNVINMLSIFTGKYRRDSEEGLRLFPVSSIMIGKCHCEKYSFQIDPEYIKFGFASCHCSICRTCHSAPFVQWSGIKKEHSPHFQVFCRDLPPTADFEVVKASLSNYRSSEDCIRYFCGTCGTHLFIQYEKSNQTSVLSGPNGSPWDGEIHFPTALLSGDSLAALEEVNS